MGNEESIPSNLTFLKINGKLLSKIPVEIPQENKLETIDLTDNLIRSLPKNITHLKSLILARNNLSHIPKSMKMSIISYPILSYLDLSFNHLIRFPKTLEKLQSLHYLLLDSNVIENLNIVNPPIEFLQIPQNKLTIFPTLPNTVTSLIVDFNHIDNFNNFTPEKYPNISLLQIKMNKLSSFFDSFIFTKLKTLNISMNSISYLPDLKILTPNLAKFDASYNFLTEFPSIPNSLIDLNLSENQISVIPESIQEQTKLSQLDLSNNLITRVPKLPPSLVILYLNNNKINEVEASNLSLISHPAFYYNDLTSIPDLSSSHISELHLFNNKISSISLNMLSESITFLQLNENNITEIPDALFDLPNLEKLNLSGNHIRTLPPSIISSHLIFLKISDNPIANGDLGENLPSTLLRLDCGFCNLQKLPQCIKYFEHLMIINAPNNNIQSIDIPSTIISINLSRNQLSTFPYLPPQIQYIDFSCNLLTKIGYTFSYPELVEADFSYNHLTCLPHSYNTPHLKTFKISHNDFKAGISLTSFPQLECLDISATGIFFEKPIPRLPNLREFITSNPDFFNNRHFKVTPPLDISFVAYAEMIGSRPTMEDAIVVKPKIFGTTDVYAVFDGHGGCFSSNFCAYQLISICQKENELTSDFVLNLTHILDKKLDELNADDGTTMALAFIDNQKKKLIAANLGDARVLLIKSRPENERENLLKFVTCDHKPTRRDEITRILNMGGKIEKGRTDGFLAISRSLGDFLCFGVSSKPDVYEIPLEPDDRWLVLCCDGVFDVITNEQVALLSTKESTARDFAYDLRNLAYCKASLDNISTIVIDLFAQNSI